MRGSVQVWAQLVLHRFLVAMVTQISFTSRRRGWGAMEQTLTKKKDWKYKDFKSMATLDNTVRPCLKVKNIRNGKFDQAEEVHNL